MTQDNDIPAQNIEGSSSSGAPHIRIALQQSERGGPPLYAHFTSLSPGQEVMIDNFGFIDSQAVQALQHKIKSGENPPAHINANVACRVALNSHALSQLTQQLSQLLNPATAKQPAPAPQDLTQPIQEQPSNNVPLAKTPEASSRGFRFPWSKK